MIEILFVLMVVFVAYVFCCTMSSDKITPPTTSEKPADSVESSSLESVIEGKQAKTPKTVPPKVIKVSTTEKPTQKQKPAAVVKKGLKNPKTGEIVTNYSNYIFTKRWIKEALVEEGLLEKVYKNNELTTELDSRIKAAISKLETMEQYKV
jgi:hypothetical protein